MRLPTDKPKRVVTLGGPFAIAAVVSAALLAALATSGAPGNFRAESAAGKQASRPVSSTPAQGARNRRVLVRDNFFRRKHVTVRRGQKVTWVWRGRLLHDVRFRKVPRGGSKRSSRLKRKGRFTRRFRKRGRYRYVCTPHEAVGMVGSVRVR